MHIVQRTSDAKFVYFVARPLACWMLRPHFSIGNLCFRFHCKAKCSSVTATLQCKVQLQVHERQFDLQRFPCYCLSRGAALPLQECSATPLLHNSQSERYRPSEYYNICYTVNNWGWWDSWYLAFDILLTIEDELHCGLTDTVNNRGRAPPWSTIYFTDNNRGAGLQHIVLTIWDRPERPENRIPAGRPKRGRSADRRMRPRARFRAGVGVPGLPPKNGRNACFYSVSPSAEHF